MGQADYIYCWQTADMMKDFQNIYGVVHNRVADYMSQANAAHEAPQELGSLREKVLQDVRQKLGDKWVKALDQATLENLLVYATVHVQRQNAQQHNPQ